MPQPKPRRPAGCINGGSLHNPKYTNLGVARAVADGCRGTASQGDAASCRVARDETVSSKHTCEARVMDFLSSFSL